MLLKCMERLGEQGLYELGMELLEDHRWLVVCAPEQKRLDAALTGLLSLYAEKDKKMERQARERMWARARRQGKRGKTREEEGRARRRRRMSYLIICPAYAKARFVEVLELNLNPEEFELKEMGPKDVLEEELAGDKAEEGEERTKLLVFGAKAFYNRLVKIERRGLGVKRVILAGFLEGLVGQQWRLYANNIMELGKLGRRCPRVVCLIRHRNPELFQWWLEDRGFEVKMVGRRCTGMASIKRLDMRLSWVWRRLEREGKRFCVYSERARRDEAGRVRRFGEAVGKVVEVVVVDCKEFRDPMELGKVAQEVGEGGHILLVNCGKEKEHWLKQGALGLPTCTKWYFEEIHDFVLEFHRRPRTKKEFRRVLKETFHGYFLQLIPQLARADKTKRDVQERVEGGYPILTELIRGYTEEAYVEPWKSFTKGAKDALKELRDARFIWRKKYRSKEDGRVFKAGKLSCSSFGALLAAMPDSAKACLEVFEEQGGNKLTDKKRAELVERFVGSGASAAGNRPQGARDKVRPKKVGSLGQVVREEQKARRKPALKEGVGRPKKLTRACREEPEKRGMIEEPEPPKGRGVLLPGRVRFGKAVIKLIKALNKRITAPVRGDPGQVEAQRRVWYQDIAREQGIPERSVHYLLMKYFIPKQVRALVKQFGELPRGTLLVLRAIHCQKVRVGPYAPLLVIVCRVKSGGLQERAGRDVCCAGCDYRLEEQVGCVLDTEEVELLGLAIDPGGWSDAGCLVGSMGEGRRCGECGLYTMQDWGCAAFYKIAEERPSAIPTDRFMRGRAEQGRFVKNREACGWFIPRVQSASIPLTAFQEAVWVEEEVIMHGWRCPREVCEGVLRERPEVGRVVLCEECGAKFKGRIDGTARMDVDFEEEIKRLVKIYCGYEPELPEWSTTGREFVLITYECEARIEGTKLIVKYPKHTGNYDIENVYVTVHGRKELATELEARGIPHSYKDIKPPKHEQPSVGFWRALLKAKSRYEEFRRKYFWSLIINQVVATAVLCRRIRRVAERAERVEELLVKILRFLKRGRFDRLAFMALEGRVSEGLHRLIREALSERWPGTGIVVEGIGRTFGRKGDQMYITPTRAAGAKTMLDAALNRAGKVLTNLVRAHGAELGLGYESVELFSHRPKDRPELAAALDLREPLLPTLWMEICMAFLDGWLVPEDFERYQSARGFPRYAPTPQGSMKLNQLVEDLLRQEVVWAGKSQRDVWELEAAHVQSIQELIEAMEEQEPSQYHPLVILRSDSAHEAAEILGRMRRVLVEYAKEVAGVPKGIVEELGSVLESIEVVMRRECG